MKNGIWQALNHTRRDRCREQVGNLNIEKINILMVSLIYDKRAIPIYGEILDKKGSSNLEEQQRVLGKILISPPFSPIFWLILLRRFNLIFF